MFALSGSLGFDGHLVARLNQIARALRLFSGVTLGEAEVPEGIPYAAAA